jgi:hypothetical protein
MLYQLSYLGLREEDRLWSPADGGCYTVLITRCPPIGASPDRKNVSCLGLALPDEAVDVIRQRVAPGLVARKPHLAINIDIKHTAGRALQLHILHAAFFKFRPDTQGLGFVASRAAIFDQDSHVISVWWQVRLVR